MIGVIVANWMLSSFVGLILGIILLCTAIFLFNEKHFFYGILVVAMAIFFFIAFNTVDPLYWLYEEIFIPVLTFLSLGSLSGILTENGDKLFVMGALAANANFRDGHKYQGTLGVMNAWIVGFVLLYAAMTYGLITAILIHAIYDIEFDFIRYGMRKING